MRHNLLWLEALAAFLIGFALMAMLNAARAQQLGDIGVSPWPVQPPARYDHAYAGKLTTVMVPSGTARKACYQLSGGAVFPDGTEACAFPGNGHCTIVLPRADPALVVQLRRHEIAHCNGWPNNHPR